MLPKLSVSRRLGLLWGVSLVSLVALSAVMITDKRRQMLDDRRAATKHVVEVAAGVLRSFEAAEQSGALTRAEAQTRAKEMLRTLRYEGKEYLWIHSLDETVMVMHPTKPELEGKSLLENRDPTGKPLFVEMNALVKQSGAGFEEYKWPRPGSEKPVPKISYVQGFTPWSWVVGSGIYIDDVDTAFWSDVRTLSLWVLGFALLLSGGFFVSRRSILTPLGEVMRMAERMARGDLSVTLKEREEADELDAMLNSLARMQSQLHTMVSAIRHGSEVMKGTMGQVLEGNVTVERTTQAQVARLEEAASTIEELSRTVQANANTAEEVDARAHDTARLAGEGGEAMALVNERMREVRQHAKRIGEITELIDEISFQTNLLAINASVESARAGEQGRGFDVVATEVRALALRSTQAAREIKTLVRDTTQSITESAVASEGASAAVNQVLAAANNLSQLVTTISRATHEQAEALSQASSAVSDIDRSTQENVAMVGQTAKAARGLSGEAQSLVEAVAQFH